MIVRATPWLKCGVNPNAVIRSSTCSTTSGVACGFNTMIIFDPREGTISSDLAGPRSRTPGASRSFHAEQLYL